MLQAGAFIALFLLFCWREYQHDKERKDLYNRIMAQDYNEYAKQGKEPPKGRNFVTKGLRDGVKNLYESQVKENE